MKRIDELSKKVKRISTNKRFSLRNLMTTATPMGVRRVKEEIVYVDTNVLHCKSYKSNLNNYSSHLIKTKTIQLDQESSGHQYEQSLNSPLLKSKGVIAVVR